MDKNGVSLEQLLVRQGPLPEDLTVDIRGGECRLRSGNDTVVIDLGSRLGAFRDGPMLWTDLLMRYVLPALAALEFRKKNG